MSNSKSSTILYIVRGIPGSGKSTLAKKLAPVVVEADQFMVDENGNYSFDPTRLSECHRLCFQSVREALEHGGEVAVANTFVQKWEYSRYITLAEEMGIPYQVISLKGSPMWENVHGVPPETVKRMLARWEA